MTKSIGIRTAMQEMEKVRYYHLHWKLAKRNVYTEDQ